VKDPVEAASGPRRPFAPIAVVGVSALFPGSLDKTGFWRDILAGKDLLEDIPETHWLIDDYYDPDPSKPDKTYARRGAFLDDVPFDPMEWGIPPSIVPQTDTTQLLALIVAKQVLDDATRGQFASMDRSRTSCILGVTSGQELMGSMVARLQRPVWVKALRESGMVESEVQAVCDRISASYTKWEEAAFPGLLGNVVAGRIANRLDIGGTNCVTDAACASTFSALSMAVNELALGQSDLVIAGGCDTMNDIFMYMCFSKTPALSPSGDCRPFSDKADGTMLGEGLGMLALKRLEDAERDGDRVYAVIRGMGSSSDGKALSVYAPLSKGQARAIERCYAGAGFGPDTVELVEAHGTGTKAGDAAEFEGLKLAFAGAAQKRAAEGKSARWCALGSVKSQIGHTKAAAGAASLVKAVLAVHHGVLPPTIKVDRPNPKMGIESSPFYLNTEARPWVKTGEHPRRAGVSSFGFGGTNFHVVVEEYQGPAEHAPKQRTSPTELVLLGAADAPALAASARALASDVEKAVADGRTQTTGTTGMLRFLARSTQEHALPERGARLSIVAESDRDLVEKLRAAAERLGKDRKPFALASGISFEEGAHEGGVAFLFPGQGSQYLGMGKDLAMTHDACKSAWDLAATVAMDPALRLDEVVFPARVFEAEAEKSQKERITATEWAQPGLGAASLATFRLLSEVGLAPSALAGHSFGEVMALHAAGVLGAEDALRVARARGERMRDAARTTEGAMSAVIAKRADVEAIVARERLAVAVANHNAPDQVVISGATAAIAGAEAVLQRAGLTTKRLEVATAFHSPIVESAVAPFASFLEDVDFGAAKTPVLANSTADAYPASSAEARRLLAGQLGAPVRFVESIEHLYAMGVRTFVEVGPGNVLTGLVGKILGDRPHRAIATDRRGQHGETAFQHAIGRLATAGLSLSLAPLWSAFEVAPDPRALPKPKMVLAINGSNYNKPYPPKGGSRALPKPIVAAPTRAAPAPSSAAAVSAPAPVASVTAKPAVAPPAPTASAPASSGTRASLVSPSVPSTPTTPTAAPAVRTRAAMNDDRSNNAPPASASAASGWLGAYTEAQRQTAETHAAFARAMADAHAAFLRSAEASFLSLAQLGGAQPGATVVSHAPLSYVAPAPIVPPAPVASAPIASAPIASAPIAPPSYAAPAPIPAAAPAFVAPAPRAPAPPRVAPLQVAPPQAAPPQPAPASRSASASVDLEATMLSVVAEKTGYPPEMITPAMELEADLGIDSIKRVEILSAVRERAPGLPELDPAQLGALRTVGEIVEHLREALGSAAGPESPSNAGRAAEAPRLAAAPSVDLEATMLTVVAEKTGYPPEMITPAMELEADLGIDSIKRVEILSAVRERAPGLPELDPAQLGALRTVGEIVEHLRKALGASQASTGAAPVAGAGHAGAGHAGAGQASAGQASAAQASAAQAGAAAAVDLQATMLAVVAEKTGYPAEMITREMELEADLGIDSIKRVEILSAVRERAPGLPELDPAQLGALRTVGQIVEHLEKAIGASGATATRDARTSSALSALSTSLPAAVPKVADGLRWVLRAVPRPASGLVQEGLLGAQDLVVTGSPLAAPLAAALARRGVRARAAETVEASTDALVYLGGLAHFRGESDALAITKRAFQFARALAPKLAAKPERGATGAFVVVEDLGGDFGLSGSERAWLGGLTGVVKTARQEWPRASVRAIDLEGGAGASDPALAERLAEELVAGGLEAEVGLRANGERLALESVARAVSSGPLPLGRGDVVVVSGGARGVTAGCVIELVRRTGARAVLLGRSALEDEPAELAHVQGDAQLKRAMLEQAKAQGTSLTPPELGKRVERILAGREIRSTLEACRAAGGDARYVAVDVQDAPGVARALEPVRAAWGPVRAIVHGAGVIADRFIADKTDEQWDRVMDTKVHGLRALLEATKDDPLRAIVMFSSVAGRTGNVGQCDYASANEILNKVASLEARRRRAAGHDVVVRSLGWGPWEGGMVSPALKARFEKLGVRLIGLAEGARWMSEELAGFDLDDVEVVLGGEPKPEALLAEAAGAAPRTETLEARIAGTSHPFVDSHRVKGAPVLPAVTAMDLLLRAARALRPGDSIAELRDLSVLKGIRLAQDDGPAGEPGGGVGDRFAVTCETRPDGTLALQLVGKTASGLPVKHYAATVVLGGSPASPRVEELGPLAEVRDTIYDGFVLFHGPLFQAIHAIDGESDRGIRGTLLGRDALGWAPDAGAPTDGAILDGALQLAVHRTKHTHRGASLPTSIARYVPGPAARPSGEVRCSALARGAGPEKARFDIEMVDARGALVARMEGVEVFVLPGSREELARTGAPAEAE
jgi:malonyl CoA-acyl carrier protein transacylase